MAQQIKITHTSNADMNIGVKKQITMAQQTAVEWLLIWFDNNNYYISSEIAQAFNQAKAMEKEQIMKAFSVGDDCGYRFAITEDSQQFNSAEQYYNETYNK